MRRRDRGARLKGVEGVPLSARQDANGRVGEDWRTRTSACTDISPLACTTSNVAEVSALRDIPILFAPRYAQRRAL